CRSGRPFLYPEEVDRLDAVLPAVLPRLSAPAHAVVARGGYLSGRRKHGHRAVRGVSGWCVFFNGGCVLHQLGAAEGDPFRYKPTVCALFPLDRDTRDRWYIRQHGYAGEVWDLPCLDPQPTTPPAAQSLQRELELARSITEAEGLHHLPP